MRLWALLWHKWVFSSFFSFISLSHDFHTLMLTAFSSFSPSFSSRWKIEMRSYKLTTSIFLSLAIFRVLAIKVKFISFAAMILIVLAISQKWQPATCCCCWARRNFCNNIGIISHKIHATFQIFRVTIQLISKLCSTAENSKKKKHKKEENLFFVLKIWWQLFEVSQWILRVFNKKWLINRLKANHRM